MRKDPYVVIPDLHQKVINAHLELLQLELTDADEIKPLKKKVGRFVFLRSIALCYSNLAELLEEAGNVE